MTQRNAWLKTAARAHETLTQHHQLSAQQAQSALVVANQQATQAAQAVDELARGWRTRRQDGRVDPQLDQAYTDYHRHLNEHAARCEASATDAEKALAQATADLRSAHGKTQVLEEILSRREKAQVVKTTTEELHGLTESWLLAGHQFRNRFE